jgi:hypothetical protein
MIYFPDSTPLASLWTTTRLLTSRYTLIGLRARIAAVHWLGGISPGGSFAGAGGSSENVAEVRAGEVERQPNARQRQLAAATIIESSASLAFVRVLASQQAVLQISISTHFGVISKRLAWIKGPRSIARRSARPAPLSSPQSLANRPRAVLLFGSSGVNESSFKRSYLLTAKTTPEM